MTRITSILLGGVAAIAVGMLIAQSAGVASANVTRSSQPNGVTVNRAAKADRLSSTHLAVTIAVKNQAAYHWAAYATGHGRSALSEGAPATRNSPAVPAGCTSAVGVAVPQDPDHWLGTCFAALDARAG